MLRALVTGSTGFTASYVIPLLKKAGYDVAGLSTQDCDIRDRLSLVSAVKAIKPDYVLHLAGTPNVPDSCADLARTVNVHGTLHLLEACDSLVNTPNKIILASSSYMYGETGSQPVEEEAHLEPTGAYGRSKRDMEYAAREWFDRLPIVMVRPFNYTGVGHKERFLVPKLIRAFQERAQDVSFVDPHVIRDYSDVRWVAHVYVDLLRRGERGTAVNVCSGLGTPLPRIVTLLERISGHHPEKRASENPATAKKVMVGNPGRLAKLGVEPSRYSLEQTLRWMLDSGPQNSLSKE